MSFLANPTTANAKQLPTGLARGFKPSSITDLRIERILRRGFMLDEDASANGNSVANQAAAIAPRIALVGGYTPRRCGIATFTADIHDSIRAAFPDTEIDVYAMAPVTNDIAFASPVRGVIVENDKDSFIAAARQIESSHADLVWLQHEFGLFGGYAGDQILELLDRVAAPLIVTLHTVMPDPDADQRRVIERIIARASKLIVMSDRAAILLRDIFGADSDQIEIIPHGVPDRPFGRSDRFKAEHALTGRKVIMTFGLLSPGKGIEAMISALPAIASAYPETLYCIVGATHPNLVAREGEAYRDSLRKLASDLGVEDNIRWIDSFLETEDLLDLIEAADVYVTPYLGANQATSGTLSYAVALGKAVVSTPYAHAVELLADDRGVLVPFGDSAALGREIGGLLDTPDRLHAMQKRAYDHGRDMIWPAFAARCHDLVSQVLQPHFSPFADLAQSPGLEGLLRICDSTGIIQHSVFSVPDRAHGYCVDDNARALMLVNRLGPDAEPHRSRLAAVFAGFVQSAWNEETQEFRNFMGYARNWLEASGSQDSCGRALWALGATSHQGITPSLRRWAQCLFDRTIGSAADFGSPRATAFAMLGADHRLDADGTNEAARSVLEKGAERLMTLFASARRDNWIWFESVLAYDNCRLPEALIRAGLRLDRPDFTRAGLETLRWVLDIQISPAGLFRPVGSESFGRAHALPRPFDQQPVEAWAAIDAAHAAYDASRDRQWLSDASRAYAWFFGSNDRGVAVADPVSGSCHDGINPRGLNLNEGAESVLAYQLAHCSIRDLMSKADAN